MTPKWITTPPSICPCDFPFPSVILHGALSRVTPTVRACFQLETRPFASPRLAEGLLARRPPPPWLYSTSKHSIGRYLSAGSTSPATHSDGVILPSIAQGAAVIMYTDGSALDAPQGGVARPVGAGVHALLGVGVDEETTREVTEFWGHAR